MKDEEFEVLYTILISPGISVNQLYNKLRGRISKVKLIRLLRELRKPGLIRAMKDPKHKQKILLFLKDDVQDTARKILTKTYTIARNNIVGEIERLTRTYIEIAPKIKNPTMLEFLKKLLLKEIDKLLSSIL